MTKESALESADPGDYVVRTGSGQFQPIDPDEFCDLYEPIGWP
jgi:hypothetical protein